MHVNGVEYDSPVDLPSVSRPVYTPGMTLETLEQQAILAAYSFFKGVKTTTAQSLGISVRSLSDKLERYGQMENERKVRHAEKAEHRDRELYAARFGRPAVQETGSEHDEKTNGNEAYAGVRAQSAAKPAEERAVPVSEREKIQSVLPKQYGSHSASKRR